ncbi:MAG: DUF362 domain-containing protein [Acidobacteria bacterium]|nr:DUF362 domain-containing protein [Acidobacteriota bacterium]
MRGAIGRREFTRRAALAAAAPLALRGTAWAAGPAAGTGRVVHVHHGRAVRWNATSGMYRDFVDQTSVNVMLDEAVRALKGTVSFDAAWQAVFPMPAPETRTLAIKVNLNNSTDAQDGAGNDIDAIPEPAIAVIRGFVRAGGLSANCTVYDSTNTAPARFLATWFKNKVKAWFPDVSFVAAGGSEGLGPAAADPRTYVTWDLAYINRPPDTRIAGTVLNADYLVNIPIVKRHGQANMTLGYKAHLGSIAGADQMHPWLFNDVPEASVLADIMGSPVVPGDPSVRSIAQKTALTVGDMLYGQPCRNWGATPRPWLLYRNEWPNCLVVSDDPVAADSVMSDLLQAEPASDGGCGSIRAWARRYLQYAEAKGQGIFEHVTLPSGQRFDPARMTYSRISYSYLDLWPSGADLRVQRFQGGSVLLQWEHYFSGLCSIWRSTNPDFSGAVRLGASPVGQFVDPAPPEPAFYRVYFGG